MSQHEIPGGILNNLWPNIPGIESKIGSIRYRCIYIVNMHDTLTLTDAKVWISQPTLSPHDEVDIGLGTSGPGTTDEMAYGTDEHPSGNPEGHGVQFFHVVTDTAGLIFGNLQPGERKPIWIRRTLQSGASSKENNQYAIMVEGATF